ncbi:hypothetical protein QVM41_34585, partial [Pseudomonas shirazica]
YAEEPKRRGVLLASGLIVGESLMGILLAGVIGATGEDAPLALAGAGLAGLRGGQVADLPARRPARHRRLGQAQRGQRADRQG